jgi:uncharacterized membrane protein required for colicin V production
MALVLVTIFLMLVVAYASVREGVFTAFITLCNIVIASIVACNLFEPMADFLQESVTGDTFLKGYEDFLCLILVFAVTMGLLRWAANSLANTEFTIHTSLMRGGAVVCGLLSGYIVSGFLLAAAQTMPLDEDFMDFQTKVESNSKNESLRRLLPPDRVWLAMMHRASYGSLGRASREEKNGFDAKCNYPLRYERYRRWGGPNHKKDGLEYDGMIPP